MSLTSISTLNNSLQNPPNLRKPILYDNSCHVEMYGGSKRLSQWSSTITGVSSFGTVQCMGKKRAFRSLAFKQKERALGDDRL